MSARLAEISGPDDFARAFDVSRETVERLETYVALLRQWQRAVNLVAPSTLDTVWHRHIADSAQLAAHAGDAKTWLDLGSGGGFPGLVVAILLSGLPGVRVHLAESNARKCAFLAEVVRQTGASVEIHAGRIESLGPAAKDFRPDIVSARALAPMEKLLALAEPFLRGEGRGLFLKGRGIDGELDAARRVYSFDLVLHASLTDKEGRIVEINRVRRRGLC